MRMSFATVVAVVLSYIGELEENLTERREETAGQSDGDIE
jgi:hypothetical protein